MPVGTVSTSLLPSHWETTATRAHPLTTRPQLCIMVQNASLSLPYITPIPGKCFRDGEENLQLAGESPGLRVHKSSPGFVRKKDS